MYNRVNVTKSRGQNVFGNNVPNNMKDVLDEVMDYEPSGIVPDINNHTFDDNEPERDKVLDDEQDVVNRFALSQKPCLVDLSMVGWDGMTWKRLM
jgi:hypothetical protein